jgi:hypothetical protein
MSDGPRALGYAIWALGIAVVYLDDRRRRLADAGDDLVVDRGGDR